MSVQYFRYIGSGPENDELLKRVREKAEIVYEARKVLSDKYGAEGFIMDAWRGSKPEGIYFTEPQNLPFLKQETRRGENLYGYFPKLSTKKGRELAEELASPLLDFSASRFILNELKLHRRVRSGRVLAHSTAGYTETSILVSIPSREDAYDPMPEVPAWLQEVKESEWLAAQGK
jgi:hypothetical protein